jgi:hypothetical protein
MPTLVSMPALEGSEMRLYEPAGTLTFEKPGSVGKIADQFLHWTDAGESLWILVTSTPFEL